MMALARATASWPLAAARPRQQPRDKEPRFSGLESNPRDAFAWAGAGAKTQSRESASPTRATGRGPRLARQRRRARQQSEHDGAASAVTWRREHRLLLSSADVRPLTISRESDVFLYTAQSIRCRSPRTRHGQPASRFPRRGASSIQARSVLPLPSTARSSSPPSPG